MLLKLLLLDHYSREQPDIIETFLRNSVRLVEATIEYHNSRMRRYVPINVPLLDIKHYVQASCVCRAADELKHSMEEILLKATPVCLKLIITRD
jgi:hypothetical protein